MCYDEVNICWEVAEVWRGGDTFLILRIVMHYGVFFLSN